MSESADDFELRLTSKTEHQRNEAEDFVFWYDLRFQPSFRRLFRSSIQSFVYFLKNVGVVLLHR